MTMVKCVAWDIDNTLLAGTFIESGPAQPPADPEMAAALAELGRRGIVHAIASKNPPAAARYAAQATGAPFIAVECGWGRKSAAVGRILADLGIGAEALAFVDDDPYERAEVSFALPDVLVLSPEDITDALGWPEFSPSVVTDEGRRRSELYLDRKRRQEAEREFGGSRDEFLRYCRTEIGITAACPADVARLHELSVRTHQFNSAGQGTSEAALHEILGSPRWDVTTVRLRDRFGDDGIVGGCVTEHGSPEHGSPEHGGDGAWTVRLLMMSCRAMGRGVIDALLAWLIRSAAGQGARTLEVAAVLNARNVPLRLALATAGFRAADGEPAEPGAGTDGGGGRAAGASPAAEAGPGKARPGKARPGKGQRGTGSAGTGRAEAANAGRPAVAAPGQRVLYRRTLAGPLPELPDWVTGPADWVTGQADPEPPLPPGGTL